MFRKRRLSKGFTLIEMLVVIIIIATLATGVVLSVSKQPGKAKIARAKSDISTYETAIESFRLDMNRYPAEEEGLFALMRIPESEDSTNWDGPYIKRIEKDPWGNPYVYSNPGFYNTEGFDIVAYGSDGEEGGEIGTEMADIGNWIDESEEGMMPE